MIADEQIEEVRFQSAVEASNRAVRAVGVHLENKKWHSVIAKKAVARPTRAEAAAYGDTEDIRAMKYQASTKWTRFEVKGRSAVFTCCDDYPYPEMMIDRANKTGPLCDWYFNLSPDLKYAAVIDGRTSDQWWVRDIYDSVKGYTGPVRFCPVSLATFIELAT